jgi:hypothetical protein
MTVCNICHLDFSANLRVRAKLYLAMPGDPHRKKWHFCESCYPKVQLVLSDLTYVFSTGRVRRTPKDFFQ